MSVIHLDRRPNAVVVELARPILSRTVLSDLDATLDELGRIDPALPVVVASGHPTIFLAGADLSEIAELDARSCGPFAELGRRVVRRLANHPAPTVAAVSGSCTGGGFDLVLGCDAVIASPDATFAHPGVARGLVTGWGGTVSLPRAVGRARARAVLLEGSAIDADAALSVGVVLRVTDDPVAGAVGEAARLARLDPSRVALWRLLKGGRFVDRFLASMVEKS